MLTSFGKFIRILRINHGEILKDMAEKLGVTSSYLSAVENGNREVPQRWIDEISSIYSLNDEAKAELTDSIYMSRKEISINLENLNDDDKNLALAFARNFDSMDSNKKQAISKLFR